MIGIQHSFLIIKQLSAFSVQLSILDTRCIHLKYLFLHLLVYSIVVLTKNIIHTKPSKKQHLIFCLIALVSSMICLTFVVQINKYSHGNLSCLICSLLDCIDVYKRRYIYFKIKVQIILLLVFVSVELLMQMKPRSISPKKSEGLFTVCLSYLQLLRDAEFFLHNRRTWAIAISQSS